MSDAGGSELLETLRAEIIQRLRPVCAHLSEDEFFRLATRIALVELKGIGSVRSDWSSWIEKKEPPAKP